MVKFGLKWRFGLLAFIVPALIVLGLTLKSNSAKVDQAEVNHTIRQELGICNANRLVDACFQASASKLLARWNYQVILTGLEQTEQYPEVFPRCHEFTHFLGRDTYSQIKNVGQLYSFHTSACHGGFYHGVIEGYFAAQHFSVAQANDSQLAAQAQIVCGKPADYSVPRYYGECVHGIGHAMMYATNQNLPRSLGLCDSLSATDRQTCYGGAFMENSSSSTSVDHPTNYTKKDDPLFPCDTLASNYQETCYQYQSSYFAELTNSNWTEVAQLCLQVPTSYRDGCFTYIGTNQVGYTQDMSKIKTDCDSMPQANYQELCYQGVLISLGGRYVDQPQHMFNFCGLLDVASRPECYKKAGAIISTWSNTTSERIADCDKLPDRHYLDYCLGKL